MNLKSANGVTGILIYVEGGFIFRVYDKSGFEFTDYDILHNDLQVTINDSDASFYEDGDRAILDHSPETLGEE